MSIGSVFETLWGNDVMLVCGRVGTGGVVGCGETARAAEGAIRALLSFYCLAVLCVVETSWSEARRR